MNRTAARKRCVFSAGRPAAMTQPAFPDLRGQSLSHYLMGILRGNAATKERAPFFRSPLRDRRRGRYEKEEGEQRKAAPCGRAKGRGERKTLRRHAGNRPPPAGGRLASDIMIADRRNRFHQEQVKIRRKVRKTPRNPCAAWKLSLIRGRFWPPDDAPPGWRRVGRRPCFPQNLRFPALQTILFFRAFIDSAEKYVYNRIT